MTQRGVLAIGMLWAQAALAQDLSFPSNATLRAEVTDGLATFALPTGPWVDGDLPVNLIDGTVRRQAWRIDAADLSTLQMLRPLREQLRQAGFDEVFVCDTAGCGGFDFRFAIPVMLPPAMEVNLRDFRFVSAKRDDAAMGLLASRTDAAGYVQVTWVTPADAPAPTARQNAPALRAAGGAEDTGDLATALDTVGRFVLQGLDFAPGSAQLTDGDVPSLAALADYLAQYPDRTVALVGHTDASGSLDANIALSKRRAGTVMERLISAYQVPRRQLEAQGMGYLSPVASNLDPDGRAKNRRVEVIVTATER